jgi:hypothetical protein
MLATGSKLEAYEAVAQIGLTRCTNYAAAKIRGLEKDLRNLAVRS